MIKHKIKHSFAFLAFFLVGFAYSQDDYIPPANFEYNQSRFQAFYFFLDGDIDNIALEEGDWIGVFNGDTCVGSWPWQGAYTPVPAMGDDGSQWTAGYLNDGDIPSFKIYDASSNIYYVANPSDSHAFEDFGLWVLDSISVINDCSGELGGIAYFDDCGVCSGGSSGHIANSDQDCQGTCFGSAYINGCDEDGDGNNDCVTADIDTCDVDCMGDVSPEDCSDTSVLGCAYYDDCGVCVGGSSDNTFNQDADCLGICFGDAIYDECDVCDGDDSSCNQPVADYQTVTTDEDSDVQITLTGSDPNEDEISFSIVSDPAFGSISGSLPNLVYTPLENFNGADSFSFVVTDGTWTSGVGVVTVIVSPVNDAPVMTDYDNQNINEDSFLLMNLSATDVDLDDLSFSVSLSEGASYELSGSTLTITPDADFFGEIEVVVSVSDGDLSDADSFTLIVDPINDPMIFSAILDQSTNEDTPITIDLDIVDVDGPYLILGSEHSGNVEISYGSSSITVTPFENWYGDVSITVSAFDGEFFEEQSFNLQVVSVNDAPVITQLSDANIDEDGSYSVSLSATDVEGDVLSFDASVDGNATVSVDGSDLTVTPDLDFNGSIQVTASVNDGDLSNSSTFELIVNPVNDAPIITQLSDATIDEDNSYTVELSASDVDEDELTFSASNGDFNILVEGSTLTVTPPQDYNGSDEVTVVVTDGELSDSSVFILTVSPVNDAPVITQLSDAAIDEDGSYTVELSASDVDEDELTFSASNGDFNILVEGSTLTVTPPQDYNGSDEVTVVVTDGELSDSSVFILTVNPVNDAPVLDVISNQSIDEDGVFTYTLSANDVDQDALYYSASVDGNASLSISGDLLTITPDENFYGNIEVVVNVTDTQLEDSQSFTLTVNPVNDAPVISSVDNQTIDEDGSLTLTLSASDIDGDSLTFDASVDGNATVSVDGSSLTVTPDSDWFGTLSLSVSVTDGEYSDNTSFQVTVNPVNDAPFVISPIGDLEVSEDSDDVAISLAGVFDDVENGSNLSLLVNETMDQLSASISDDVLTLSFVPNAFGQGVVTVTASDVVSRLSVSTTFNVSILSVNDAPVIVDLSNQNIDEDEQT